MTGKSSSATESNVEITERRIYTQIIPYNLMLNHNLPAYNTIEDIDMYMASSSGGRWCFYCPEGD